jgi:PST family polysaccharide transporter
LVSSSLGSTLTILSLVAGLPFGPIGVAIAYSTIGLFIGMPLLYYFAGRAGPVSAVDLWRGIFRFVPLWIIVSGVAWFVRLLLLTSPPLLQLIVCAPVALFAGTILICVAAPMRRVAFSLLGILRELKSRISFFNAR